MDGIYLGCLGKCSCHVGQGSVDVGVVTRGPGTGRLHRAHVSQTLGVGGGGAQVSSLRRKTSL